MHGGQLRWRCFSSSSPTGQGAGRFPSHRQKAKGDFAHTMFPIIPFDALPPSFPTTDTHLRPISPRQRQPLQAPVHVAGEPGDRLPRRESPCHRAPIFPGGPLPDPLLGLLRPPEGQVQPRLSATAMRKAATPGAMSGGCGLVSALQHVTEASTSRSDPCDRPLRGSHG